MRSEHERRLPVEVLLLLGLLLVLEHLRAWLGDAGFEHFEEVISQVMPMQQGLGWLPPDGEIPNPAGGGPLFARFWWLLWRSGMPWHGAQAVYFLLDAAAIAGWLILTPRRLPRLVVWGVAFWLVLEPVPKLHLAENSTFVAFAAPSLFALTLGLAERPRWSALLGAVVLYGLCIHLSLVAVPIGLVLAFAVVRSELKWRWLGVLLVVAAAGVAVAPIVLEQLGDLDAGQIVTAAVNDPALPGLGTPLSLVIRFCLQPAMVLGLAGLLLGGAEVRALPESRRAALWLVVTVLPIAAVDSMTWGADYHFVAGTPARAFVGGVGLFGCIRALQRWRGDRRLPPRRLAAAGLALSCLVVGIAVGVRAGEPGRSWRAEDPVPICPGMDAGVCAPWSLRGLLRVLDAAGLSPDRQPDLEFVGAYALCLEPAWRWAAGPRTGESEAVLLLPADSAAQLPGGVQAGRFVAFRSVHRAAIPDQPTAETKIQVEAGQARAVYVELRGACGLSMEDVVVGPGRLLGFGQCPELIHRAHATQRDGGAWALVEPGAHRVALEVDGAVPRGFAAWLVGTAEPVR